MDEQIAQRVTEVERVIGRPLYREERKAMERGEDVVQRAKQITNIEANLGRRLHRDERMAVLKGEQLFASSVSGETWLAHPDTRGRGKTRVFQGGAVDSNRRRH